MWRRCCTSLLSATRGRACHDAQALFLLRNPKLIQYVSNFGIDRKKLLKLAKAKQGLKDGASLKDKLSAVERKSSVSSSASYAPASAAAVDTDAPSTPTAWAPAADKDASKPVVVRSAL